MYFFPNCFTSLLRTELTLDVMDVRKRDRGQEPPPVSRKMTKVIFKRGTHFTLLLQSPSSVIRGVGLVGAATDIILLC